MGTTFDLRKESSNHRYSTNKTLAQNPSQEGWTKPAIGTDADGLHVLDRSGNEDVRRTSSNTQAINLKQLRQMALNLLRQLFVEASNHSMPILALTFLGHLNQFGLDFAGILIKPDFQLTA